MTAIMDRPEAPKASADGLRRYSIFSLVRNALAHEDNWQRKWRSPAPKPRYDALIIGGGGHGLGAAYFLARDHGMTNIAVLEKGMARRRQYRPQHHDYSVELRAPAQRAVS